MNAQKALFQLDSKVHYLNCAYKAPLLKACEQAALEALQKARNPFLISQEDFFSEAQVLRNQFASLVQAKKGEDIAIMPSVSYGFSSAFNGLKPPKNASKILLVEGEFPSGYFASVRWAEENGLNLEVIREDELDIGMAGRVNQKLLEAIDEETALVLISSVHWIHGYALDLEAIGSRCDQVGALFFVDGTQSVGVRSMDVEKMKIDALVCAGYKWLLGPYSMTLGFFSKRLQGGIPIEEAWLNRKGAEDFSSLANYEERYASGAARFNMGQSSNFILLPMMSKALGQIMEWGVDSLELYLQELNKELIDWANDRNLLKARLDFRAHHLTSLEIPSKWNAAELVQSLKEKRIYVSRRESSIRIATHIFNDAKDMEILLSVLKKFLT